MYLPVRARELQYGIVCLGLECALICFRNKNKTFTANSLMRFVICFSAKQALLFGSPENSSDCPINPVLLNKPKISTFLVQMPGPIWQTF